MKIFYLNLLALSIITCFWGTGNAQCVNGTPYITAAAPTSGTTSISGCTYFSEYNTITGVVAGTTYISSVSPAGCITVRSGTPGGPVVAFGSSPLSWTATVSGTYYIHYNVDCVGCGQNSVCHSTSIQFVSGGGGGGGAPCSSITNIIGCGTSQTSTMTGTGSWNVNACGWSTPGVESIWAFTATASGTHNINVTGISGGFIDVFWMNSTTGCGSTGWNCIDDVFSTGSYGSMNWTAGQTYYILFDPESTAGSSITFSVNCPNPGGPVFAGDCVSAVPVCTNINFAVDPSGYGNTNELCTSCTTNPSTNPASTHFGCLMSGELNSTWMVVNVATSGTLEFSFGAPSSSFLCYDWIMWPYNAATCTAISNNTLAPVRCNWNSPCDGFTGIGSTPPAGGAATNFEPNLNVTAGSQYLICFSNYSSAVTNVPLNFFGTASVSCTPLPVEMIDFTGTNQDNYNLLRWFTGSEVASAWFDIELSSDGNSFKKVGSVNAAGNSTLLKEYSFRHDEPQGEINYYRLKQVDINGAYKYSDIIAISTNNDGLLRVLNAYPNPANDFYRVQIYMPEIMQLSYSVKNLNGTTVFSQDLEMASGTKTIDVPVQHLAKGVYLLELVNYKNGQKELLRFVVN